VTGALISASTPRLPTGPTIVLCAGGIMLVSLLGAPGRGLLAGMVRTRRSRRNLRELGVLEDLYILSRQHADPLHPHPAVVLRTMTSGPESVEPGLQGLKKRHWVRLAGPDAWMLTDSGLAAAERIFGDRHAGEDRGTTAEPG